MAMDSGSVGCLLALRPGFSSVGGAPASFYPPHRPFPRSDLRVGLCVRDPVSANATTTLLVSSHAR
jgi:hypothetical protein